MILNSSVVLFYNVMLRENARKNKEGSCEDSSQTQTVIEPAQCKRTRYRNETFSFRLIYLFFKHNPIFFQNTKKDICKELGKVNISRNMNE